MKTSDVGHFLKVYVSIKKKNQIQAKKKESGIKACSVNPALFCFSPIRPPDGTVATS